MEEWCGQLVAKGWQGAWGSRGWRSRTGLAGAKIWVGRFALWLWSLFPALAAQLQGHSGIRFNCVTLSIVLVNENRGSVARQTWVWILTPVLTGVWAWGSYLTSMNLGFLIALQVFRLLSWAIIHKVSCRVFRYSVSAAAIAMTFG